MAEVVAGLLTSAVVKIACDKISSAIAQQTNLALNFSADLEHMKDTMVSMDALFKDAEEESVKKKTVRLCLKRLKHAALDISDMIDDYEDTETESTVKMPGIFCCFPATGKKMVLANEMKDMRENLRKISEQFKTFNFTEITAASKGQQHCDDRETKSSVKEEEIIGRDEVKKEITDIISANRRTDGTMVLPIYGLGGMGKSTLAQLVYNDTQFKKYDHRVWVYVSQEFDLRKIGRSIIEELQTEGVQQNIDTLQKINRCLDNLLPGKKILIVLDDIWEEDGFKLEELKNMIEKNGSMVDVIVTTRSERTANKICTSEPYKLKPLTDGVCWDIIRRLSGFEGKSNKEKLEEIGLDIAKKCGGVALAARALGYVLKYEDLDGWSNMNKSDIWNVSHGVDNAEHKKVLPSLKLSYEHMQSILRLCFSYCAIFPKGHDIHEEDLIHQWFALGFFKEPSEGKKYIKRLLGMSFLQHSKLPMSSEKHVARYNMHDLVHDLARSVLCDELIVIDAADAAKKSNTSEQKYCRYVLLNNYDGQTKLSSILSKKVRALHLSGCSNLGLHDGFFSLAKSLRILDFSGCSDTVLPASIGQLKQLKCLIAAPKTQNEKLPESIVELSKLQYLNLHGSSLISELPRAIGNVGSLIHLDISGCSELFVLPESLGGLKAMVHLDMSGCNMISELPGSLGNLTNLQRLDLSWCSRIRKLPDSVGNLIHLQHLILIACFSLTAIPECLCSLTRLQHLSLARCPNLGSIPEAVGSLVSLQYFDMSRCPGISELPESFSNLRSLLHLNLARCHRIKVLPLVLSGLTALQYLNMSWIFLVDGALYDDAMRNLTNLEHLDLSRNKDLRCLPESIGNLKKLHTLDLSYCEQLKSLPDSISSILTLKSLLIEGCSKELMDQVSSREHYSLTLPLFKVRVDDASTCSNLPDLEDAYVGELNICSLENVRSPDEACKAKLSDKNNLSSLTLAWTLDAYRFLDDKDLLGELEPPRGLKHLRLDGYSSPSFPSWLMGISHHLPNLVRVFLFDLPTCSNLPPLGQLWHLEKLILYNCPSITKIDKSLCGGKGAFRRLTEFRMNEMRGLEEWSTTYSVEDGVEEFMFPVLEELEVCTCPKLRLKPCPPTFRKCRIVQSDQVISSLEAAGGCHLTPSAPSMDMIIDVSYSCSLDLFHHFPDLRLLRLRCCYDLEMLPESMRHLASLKSLTLVGCGGISALPEWLGGLSSLKFLGIISCNRIESLPSSIQQLTKLQELRIEITNPELKQWCESKENKKLLAHIKHVFMRINPWE